MPPVDHTSWVCTACRRRVPGYVDACRCGGQRPVDASTDSSPASEPPTFVRPLLLVGMGLIIGAAIAIPAWTQLSRGPALTEHPQPSSTEIEAADTTPPVDTLPVPTVEPKEPSPAEPKTPADSPPSLEDVIARVVPAVTSIQAGNSRGTGFFVRTDTLVTNAHVVDGQSTVKLQIGDATYTARVTLVARGSDLAVLQVLNGNPRQPVLEFATPSDVRVGQEVIAVGSALGVLSNTVTRGIVSAVRQVGSVRLLQTDAAINPGNSGGPLVDRSGKVIGVNSMTVARQVGEGVAFAVSIEHVGHLLSGSRAPADAAGPLGGLQQMFSPPSREADDNRARSERALEQALERVAQRADELDEYWKRYERWCVAAADRNGDRPWFGIYRTGGISINTTSPYDCGGWLETVRTHAGTIRTALEQVSDIARRDGIYPGVLRELRGKFRLNWN